MPTSNIHDCTDCLMSFCETCEPDFTRCPDCKQPLCESCSLDALDARMSRCATCHDPDLATKLFPGGVDWNENRKFYKHYTAPRKGQMP